MVVDRKFKLFLSLSVLSTMSIVTFLASTSSVSSAKLDEIVNVKESSNDVEQFNQTIKTFVENRDHLKEINTNKMISKKRSIADLKKTLSRHKEERQLKEEARKKDEEARQAEKDRLRAEAEQAAKAEQTAQTVEQTQQNVQAYTQASTPTTSTYSGDVTLSNGNSAGEVGTYAAQRVAQATGTDVQTWQYIIARESNGQPSAYNPSGASGLFQTMPFWGSTATVEDQINTAIRAYNEAERVFGNGFQPWGQ